MQQKLRGKFQEWTQNIDSSYKLILTNDLDSLFTVALLRYLFGCEIGLFYDFERLYFDQPNYDKSKLIGCDLAIEDENIKTFCNHVTRMTKDDPVNPMSANLNNFATGVYGGGTIKNTTYFKKYNGSTALTVLSLYGAFEKLIQPDKSALTDEQLKILASIDSYYLGAYHPKHYEAHRYFKVWQGALGLEMFQPLFDKMTKDEWESFQREHGLKKNISAIHNDDKFNLHTDLPLQYLQEQFPMLDFSLTTLNMYCEFEKPAKLKFNTGQSKHDLNGRVFSMAVTNRNEVKITRYKE